MVPGRDNGAGRYDPERLYGGCGVELLVRLPRPGVSTGPHVLGFYGLAGLASLAKGPVGGVLPGLIVGVFLLLRRDIGFVRRMHVFSGGLLYLGVAGSWYGLALWQGGEAFFEKQILKENVLRFISSGAAGAGHEHPFYYFLPNLFMGMAPWSFFLATAGLFFVPLARALGSAPVPVPARLVCDRVRVLLGFEQQTQRVYPAPVSGCGSAARSLVAGAAPG